MSDTFNSHLDSYLKMYERAWEQFNKRRDFEVQMGRTFWTGLAAAIAGSITLPSLPQILGERMTLIFVAILPLALHGIWCWGMGRAQKADREIAFFWERRIQTVLDARFDEKVEKHLKRPRSMMGRLLNWTYVFQLGVTIFLCAVLIAINWSRFETDDIRLRRELELKRLKMEVMKLEEEINTKQAVGERQ